MPTLLDKVNVKARRHGYGRVSYSTRPDKRFMLIYRGKVIHFGHPSANTFLDHGDEKRRENYRKRHRGIVRKDGREAYRVRGTAAHISYHLLW